MPTVLDLSRHRDSCRGAGHDAPSRARVASRSICSHSPKPGIRDTTTAGASSRRCATVSSSSFSRRGASCTTCQRIRTRSTTSRRPTPSRADAFERGLRALVAETTRSDAVSKPQAVTPEVEQRLRALGYVSGVSAKNLEERRRGDPKDTVALYNLLLLAGEDSEAGRYDAAAAKVQQALAADPEIIEAYSRLGNIYTKAGRHADAVAVVQAGARARSRTPPVNLQPRPGIPRARQDRRGHGWFRKRPNNSIRAAAAPTFSSATSTCSSGEPAKALDVLDEGSGARRRSSAIPGQARGGLPRAQALRRGREGAQRGCQPARRRAPRAVQPCAGAGTTRQRSRGARCIRGRSGGESEELRRAVQPGPPSGEGRAHRRGGAPVPRRRSRRGRSLPRGTCIWPRRCWISATCSPPSRRRSRDSR